MIRTRIVAICCSGEQADDRDILRTDSNVRLACGRLPDTGMDLCSHPILPRLEDAPRLRHVIRLTYALVDARMGSYPREPEAVIRDPVSDIGSPRQTRQGSMVLENDRKTTPTVRSSDRWRARMYIATRAE